MRGMTDRRREEKADVAKGSRCTVLALAVSLSRRLPPPLIPLAPSAATLVDHVFGPTNALQCSAGEGRERARRGMTGYWGMNDPSILWDPRGPAVSLSLCGVRHNVQRDSDVRLYRPTQPALPTSTAIPNPSQGSRVTLCAHHAVQLPTGMPSQWSRERWRSHGPLNRSLRTTRRGYRGRDGRGGARRRRKRAQGSRARRLTRPMLRLSAIGFEGLQAGLASALVARNAMSLQSAVEVVVAGW
jgi:hypothetical protein